MILRSKKLNILGRGFTLLELLVVVAIIGLLSTLIIGSVGNSRKNGKDAAIKQQLKQFESLLALEFSVTGSYANLQPDLWFPDTACNASFSGTNATKAREICNRLVSLSGTWGIWGGPYSFYIGNAVNNTNRYSMMVPLNAKNTLFCLGSSGNSDTETGGGGSFLATGCYDNP